MKKGAATICVLTALLFLVSCGGTGAFESAVKSNEYSKAISVYAEKIQGNAEKEKEAEQFLESYLNNAWQDYLDEKITDTEFEAVIETVESLCYKYRKLHFNTYDIESAYPIVEASKSAYKEGVTQMNEGDYEAAIDSFEQVKSIDSKNYEDAQAKQAEATEKYISSLLSEIQEKADAFNYEGALDLISEGEQVVGIQSALESRKKIITTSWFESRMTQYADENNFAALYALYGEKTEDEYCTISSAMTKLYSEQKTSFVKDILGRSVEAYKSSGYSAAIPVISEGLVVLPEDAELLKFNDLYLSCVPVSLGDINTTKKTHSIEKSEKDNYGNNYTGKILYYSGSGWHPDEESVFVLGRKYNAFSGICFGDDLSENGVQINILADGVNIYTSELIFDTTESINIFLDVTNVNILSIEFSLSKGYIYLADAQLTRTLTDEDLRF